MNQTAAIRTPEALEAAQYFTPILRANMAKLMEAGGDRAQIARTIALVFVDCENIADHTAHHLPSPRHIDAWIKSLIDHAKALRQIAAHMEARADQPANMTLATDEELAEEQSLLSPEEQSVLRHLPTSHRTSSVDTLRFYEASKGEAEAAELVLRNAADYLYNRQTETTWEAADRGDAAAIDLLDDLRGMDWGDLKQTALIDAAQRS
jgi:hypothetical protein